MTTSSDRRMEPRRQLAELDRSTWRLWALSFAVTLALAIGVAFLFYPAIKWHALTLEPRLLDILPRLVGGLVILVFLETFYILGKQRELNRLRNFILTAYAEPGPFAEELPRDPLTGVLDRRILGEVLKRETAWVERYHIPLCVALFDIRGFRKVNEKEGNLASDLILKDLAQTIQATVRRTDTVLRYGPDQFLCLLPRTDHAGGEAFARRVEERCQLSSRLRELVVDTGTAVYEPRSDPNVMIANAERDLAAKRASAAVPPAAT